jgi:YegS/Rv2252/BmrU family lipid kinase
VGDLQIRFIFNPRAGLQAGRSSLLKRIDSFIASNRLLATVVPTARSRHATELARQAADDGCDLVVAVGGDGMINEVAQSLVGTNVILGLLPSGSGNGLGRNLGLQSADDLAFQTLLTGRPWPVDTGLANGLPFFNIAGSGFDAEVSRRFNRIRSRGLLPYFLIGFRTWVRRRPEPVVISTGAATIAMPAVLVAVANGEQYGGGACLAPGARIDDGQMDLIAVKPTGIVRSVSLLVRLFRHSFDRSPDVIRLRGERFVIRRPAKGRIHTDGEVHETDADIEVVVRPGSLRVMTPPTFPAVGGEGTHLPIDGEAGSATIP